MLPFLILLQLVSGAFAAPPHPIEVHGHRGARAVTSENTLAAFEYAWRQGADVLEMDLAVTRDGQLVISHDPHLQPELCLGPGGDKLRAPVLIHDLDLAQVQSYDCGSLQNPRFPSQKPASDRKAGKTTPPPTLDQVFALVKKLESEGIKRPPIRFNIETKSFLDMTGGNYPVSPTAFAKLWVSKVKEHGMLSRSILQSFDYRTLVAAKGIDPKVIIAPLSEDPEEDLVATAKRLGAEIVSPKWDMPNVNAETVKNLHRIRVKIVPWTPNAPEAWAKLAGMGVDGLISDDPAKLIAFLKAR